MSELKKIILEIFPSNGMTGILHKKSYFPKQPQKSVQVLPARYHKFFFTLKSFFLDLPGQRLCQIINISEMVLKSHAADPAVRGKIIDGIPVQDFSA